VKKFETPEMEIEKFDVADIITTSDETTIPGTGSNPGTILPDDNW